MTKTFLITVLVLIPLVAFGQIVPTITKVETAGVSEQVLSADVRDAMQKLVGQRYDAEIVDPVLRSIEGELPDYVVATRNISEATPGLMRLVFVLAPKTPGITPADSNVNSQYVVESVEVRGITQDQYSSMLNDDLQNMKGLMLDSTRVEDLRQRLRSEPQLKGKYSVSDKIERGSQPGQVKLVYEANKLPWAVRVTFGNKIDINGGGVGKTKNTDVVESAQVVGVPRSAYSDALDLQIQLMAGKRVDHLEADHLKEKLDAELKHRYEVTTKFRPGAKPDTVVVVLEAKLIPWIPERTLPEVGAYHPKQGISAFVDGTIYKGITFGLGTDGDTLTERYKGFMAGFESRMLGTPRLGAKVRFETLGILWKRQTLELLGISPEIPGAYRIRRSIEPSIAFAFTPTLYMTAGADFTEIQMMHPVEHWESSNAATASVRYKSRLLKTGNGSNQFSGGYEIRSGTRNLDSDWTYTRHFWEAGYVAKIRKNTFRFSFKGGKITGSPPLFERFSLGNTVTLRGWNKYDIDPVGGTRMFHFSTEYSYKYFGVFMDNGSIWTAGDNSINRSSFGVFLGPLKVGIPLSCSHGCGATFLIHIN